MAFLPKNVAGRTRTIIDNAPIGLFSVQAFSCHKCPPDSSFNDCLANVEPVCILK